MAGQKLTEAEKAAARRLLTAAKTWWHAPIGHEAIELDELIEAFEDALMPPFAHKAPHADG